MTEAGLWKPRRQRAAQIHQPRNRRACVGELIQIDGSKVAQLIQAQRDDRRCGGTPTRTNSGAKPRLARAEVGKKRPSKFTLDDMNAAVRKQTA